MCCTLGVGRRLLYLVSILQTNGRHSVSWSVFDGRAVGTYKFC